MQGYISTEEFLSIPELSINPLHSRMGQIFNHVNFKACCCDLSYFGRHTWTAKSF